MWPGLNFRRTWGPPDVSSSPEPVAGLGDGSFIPEEDGCIHLEDGKQCDEEGGGGLCVF